MKRFKQLFLGLTILFAVMGGVSFADTWDWSGVIMNAKATTGDGTVVRLQNPYTNHTWVTVVTGGPSATSITLQGSIDGTNWAVLDTTTTTTAEMRHIIYKPVLWIKANVGTLTSGTSPTVTVTLLSTFE